MSLSRQRESECASLVLLAHGGDAAPLRLDQYLHDGEPQAEAGLGQAIRHPALRLPVFLERMRQIFLGDTRARVLDGELELVGSLGRSDSDLASSVTEFDGISNQVRHDPQEPCMVAQDFGGRFDSNVPCEGEPFLLAQRRNGIAGFFDHPRNVVIVATE